MSYYAPIDFSTEKNYSPLAYTNNMTQSKMEPNQNFHKKNKFVYLDNPVESTPGHYLLPQTKSSIIDYESNLLKPQINSKDKTKLELNNDLHPDNYNINYSNNSNSKSKSNFYFTNKHSGAGRGFGNLNVSNFIRNGETSRKDFKEFREQRESNQMFDHQIQYLDRNYQDPNHLVMPIPRGGEMTRQQNQLEVNTMRNQDHVQNNFNEFEYNEDESKPKFTFTY
jgi:hypothetical protein